MKITVSQAEDIVFEEFGEDLEVVEVGDWISEGKYEICTAVFKQADKYYMFHASRSGSPFTDWHYDWEDYTEIDCQEVVAQEVVVKKWVVKT